MRNQSVFIRKFSDVYNWQALREICDKNVNRWAGDKRADCMTTLSPGTHFLNRRNNERQNSISQKKQEKTICIKRRKQRKEIFAVESKPY